MEISIVRVILNGLLAKHDRFKVLCIGAAVPVGLKLILWILRIIGQSGKYKQILIAYAVRLLRLIPSVRSKINAEKLHAQEAIQHSLLTESGSTFDQVPETGVAVNEVLSILEAQSKAEKVCWSGGNLTGAVYASSETLDQIQSFALASFGKTNLLHPDVFKYTRQMEAEVVRMTLNLFSGDEVSCGSITSGGTESILLAVKAYRDSAREKRGVVRPNLVIPSTAHAAFVKAGEYFGIEIRRAYCDPSQFFEVSLGSMATLIDCNTIALVGSAPQYPHGTIDPIPAIAKLAKSWNIGCHVDACLGSFLLPFLKEELPFAFDFALEGVTSISCDTHKYAYAPKGSSVLMWRSSALRKYQYSVCSEWEGGLYATPTIAGSRCSLVVVGAWASIVHLGVDGYKDCASRIHAGAKLIESTVRDLSDELHLLGRADTSVVSFTSNSLNIYDIADSMKKDTSRKWALAILQKPAGIHFAVTMANVDNCPEFCDDLVTIVRRERERVGKGGTVGSSESAVIYGSTAKVPSVLVKELIVDYLDTCYALQ